MVVDEFIPSDQQTAMDTLLGSVNGKVISNTGEEAVIEEVTWDDVKKEVTILEVTYKFHPTKREWYKVV